MSQLDTRGAQGTQGAPAGHDQAHQAQDAPRLVVFADTDGELIEGTPSLSEDFHFHFYFDEGSRDSAMAVRERLKREATFAFQLPPVREKPVGPHRFPIWSVWVDRANFAHAALWMMQHHAQHSVLVHPNIDDGYKDHTDHAMWLGTPVALKLEVFHR
jgi:aromatic ring-cleaving dioxygenase